MLFTQIEFLLFFIGVYCCQKLTQHNAVRKIILLAASYYFYAYWDWRFLCLLLVPTCSDYLIGRYLARTDSSGNRRLLISMSLLINLGILAAFKYFNFFITSIQHLLSPIGFHVSTLSIILPLGISFYTFRTLSYTIDVYRRKLEPCTSLLDYAVFVSFFPTMVAGPIVRASELLPQLARPVSMDPVGLLSGLRSFVIGVFLKIFVADRIALFSDFVIANISVFHSVTVWMAALGYSLQLYCDFAGYSMMAIGVTKTIGYEVPENFNYPYLSRNIADFWRRWHITLSNWIRDYVYITLGGNRKGEVRTYVNIILAMTLCGFWHGAAWTFAAWGLFHGLALVVHRIWTRYTNHGGTMESHDSDFLSGLLGRTVTVLTVVVGWVLFRADGFNAAIAVLGKMFYPGAGILWLNPFVLCAFFFFALIQLAELFRWGEYHKLPLSAWYTPVIIFTMIWLCIAFPPKEFAPFIYSQF